MKFFQHSKILLAIAFCVIWAAPSHAPNNIYWKMWKIDTLGIGADGIHLGDINRDGMIDVVSGWEQSGDLMFYLNPGPKTVRNEIAWSQVDISGGLPIRGIEDAAFADLDLDGFADAIISSIEGDTQSLGIHWPESNELLNPNNWRGINLAPEEPAAYMKARSAQIDGVAGADIVAGSKATDDTSAGIYWFKAPEGSHPDNAHLWQRFYVGPIDYKTVTLELRDMDGDSLVDIIAAGRNGVYWFKNPGQQALRDSPEQAVWERVVITETGSEFTFCDSVIDNKEDMVVTTSRHTGTVAKWLKRMDASGRKWEEYPISSDRLRADNSYVRKFVLKGVSCGYVDGDDRIDLVFTGSGDGHGVFMMSPRTTISSGMVWDLSFLTPHAYLMKFDNLKLVDIDGDGDLDVVTTEEGEGVFTKGKGVLWLENPLIR